jgi:type I restriction enzyme S subunit
LSFNRGYVASIPESWALAELSDVCSKITDGTHKTPDYRDNGIRFISIKNIKPFEPVDWSAYERFISEEEHRELIKRCKPEYGDILFPRIGTLGYAKRVDFQEEVSIFVGLGLAKPIRELVLSEYLEYWLNHPTIDKLSRERANGSGRLTLPLEESRRLPVPMAPLAEQIRIVEKLDELLTDLDAGVAELKAAQRKLAQYRQSLLKAAVEGALTADWRAAHGQPQETGAELLQRILSERRARWSQKQIAKFAEQGKAPPKDWQAKYSEPVAPELTDLPSLPAGWVWASLDQLAEIQGGIQKQPSRAPVANRYPFLRVANVARGQLKLDEIHEIELFDGELERLALQKGDILVVEGNGSLTEIGRCALWDGSIENAVHQNHLIRARPVLVHGEFIEAWLNSLRGIERMSALAATTSGLYTLSVGKISKIPVPLPPLAEQGAAVEALASAMAACVEQKVATDRSLKQAAAQRKNIIKAAFAGQLVKQNPNDEPASELLARIRAERTSNDGSAPRRRRKTA